MNNLVDSRKTFSKNKYIDFVNQVKHWVVSRLFWGRNNFYKNVTQTTVVILTLIITFTGVISRISGLSTEITGSLAGDELVTGTFDLLSQGGSLEAVVRNTVTGITLKFSKYIVQPGDNLNTVAEKFKVTKDTIRWASKDVLGLESFLTDSLSAGTILTVPEINGILHVVRPGDSIDSLVAQYSPSNDEANRFNIIQFNNLDEPYTLVPGERIFIPDGNVRGTGDLVISGIPEGIFINPLSSPDCYGYSISRGFLYYHNGVDLARWPGCPISSVANGVVTYAGWSNYGEGYNVRIDHGGGITSHYYHGDGTFWVKTGDKVTQGQPILMMGTTGNSTGVHLHFSLFKDGVAVDPFGFVPY